MELGTGGAGTTMATTLAASSCGCSVVPLMCDSSRDRSTTADVDVAVGGARARRSARKKTMMKMGEEGKAARVAGGWAR